MQDGNLYIENVHICKLMELRSYIPNRFLGSELALDVFAFSSSIDTFQLDLPIFIM